jgi:hypothetical protein
VLGEPMSAEQARTLISNEKLETVPDRTMG